MRWLLSHQAGVPALREDVPLSKRFDWGFWTEALAAEAPWWEPGSRHGYHALTFGHLVGEVVRRVDGRSLGSYFRGEFSEPLGLDFHIGLAVREDARVAELIAAPKSPPGAADPFAAARKNPQSLVGRVFANPTLDTQDANSHAWRSAEIPAVNGHGTARGLARVYGALACGGALDGAAGALARADRAREHASRRRDPTRCSRPLHSRFGLGFMLTQPMIPFGPNPRSFGHPGFGGSIAFADPDAQLGFAYTMNQLQTGLGGDARGFALIGALYAALSRREPPPSRLPSCLQAKRAASRRRAEAEARAMPAP